MICNDQFLLSNLHPAFRNYLFICAFKTTSSYHSHHKCTQYVCTVVKRNQKVAS